MINPSTRANHVPPIGEIHHLSRLEPFHRSPRLWRPAAAHIWQAVSCCQSIPAGMGPRFPRGAAGPLLGGAYSCLFLAGECLGKGSSVRGCEGGRKPPSGGILPPPTLCGSGAESCNPWALQFVPMCERTQLCKMWTAVSNSCEKGDSNSQSS